MQNNQELTKKIILTIDGEKLTKEMTFEEVRKQFYPALKAHVNNTNNRLIYNKVDTKDFLQELEIELWRAFEDYDYELGNHFSTFLGWKLKKGVKRATYHRYAQKNQNNGIQSMSEPIGEDSLKLEDMFTDNTQASDEIEYEELMKIVKDSVDEGEEELLKMTLDIKNNPVQVYANKHGITRQAANQRLLKFKKKLRNIVKEKYLNV